MEERVLNVLKQVLEVQSIDATCSQENCAAWDSLRHLNVCFSLEGEFDIMFTPEEMAEMKSVNDIVRVITKKLA